MASFCLALLLLLDSTAKPVSAQTPIATEHMTYITLNGETLYVQGGADPSGFEGFTDQFFSLDLTRNWIASSPPWRAFTRASSSAPPPVTWGHSMTLSHDSQTVTLWDRKRSYKFNLKTMIWDTPLPLPGNPNDEDSVRAVKDPGGEIVYIPNGGVNGTNMAAYDSVGNVLELPMPPPSIMRSEVSGYSAVWSTLRGTMLLYGGSDSAAANPQGIPFLVEYNPKTNIWSRVSTSGTSPGDLYYHCMVPASDGTKMVVFGGGDIATRTPLGSIYILDLGSMSWTKGVDIEQGRERSSMACTVAGDSFIA
ncbi:hypothetical protein BG011_003938 [Mortierella polycephala]|uniref:Galactose oxidase n=1 Tax=Mortierella polycephala TaxID=41804 RepID=A0A9P6U3C9_9FUNG|nr:hypothetical protein BG011_003938 [Mortierella polycephala]